MNNLCNNIYNGVVHKVADNKYQRYCGACANKIGGIATTSGQLPKEVRICSSCGAHNSFHAPIVKHTESLSTTAVYASKRGKWVHTFLREIRYSHSIQLYLALTILFSIIRIFYGNVHLPYAIFNDDDGIPKLSLNVGLVWSLAVFTTNILRALDANKTFPINIVTYSFASICSFIMILYFLFKTHILVFIWICVTMLSLLVFAVMMAVGKRIKEDFDSDDLKVFIYGTACLVCLVIIIYLVTLFPEYFAVPKIESRQGGKVAIGMIGLAVLFIAFYARTVLMVFWGGIGVIGLPLIWIPMRLLFALQKRRFVSHFLNSAVTIGTPYLISSSLCYFTLAYSIFGYSYSVFISLLSTGLVYIAANGCLFDEASC